MMNEPHGSGKSDDIFDELLNPNPVCAANSIQESSRVSDFTKIGNTTVNVPSHSSSASNCGLNEDQLKKDYMILYLDLVVTEMDNKKTLSNIKTEYLKLQEETESLKKSLSDKDKKIAQLTAENTQLKKNISSLYKTAKSEIEQKDAMLQEANKKIDKMYPWSNKSTFQEKHSVESSQYQPSTSRMSSVPSQSFTQNEDHARSKDGANHKNDRNRNYEDSQSEFQVSSKSSTSSNPYEHRSNRNRFDANHKFSYHNSEKHKRFPSRDTVNERCNTYNRTDRRNSSNKSKNNETNERNERNTKRQRHES